MFSGLEMLPRWYVHLRARVAGSRASAICEKNRVNLVKKAVVLFVTSVGQKEIVVAHEHSTHR